MYSGDFNDGSTLPPFGCLSTMTSGMTDGLFTSGHMKSLERGMMKKARKTGKNPVHVTEGPRAHKWQVLQRVQSLRQTGGDIYRIRESIVDR